MLKALILIPTLALAQNAPAGLGRPATQQEIDRLNLTVYPDGKGLPKGSGSAATGLAPYKAKCAVCHNDKGEGRQAQYPALVGGIGTLTKSQAVKTVGSYWPYATTVFDYIRRSMPFDHPRSLAADEVYGVTALILHWNGIIAEKDELNERNLAAVKMPNRDGFFTYQGPLVDPRKPKAAKPR